MIPVTILSEAESELEETISFYEQRYSGLGLNFANEVEVSVGMIAQFPDRWPLREDGTRRYLLQRFPYVIIYTYSNKHIWVIAFAHCRRRPKYWSSRVENAKDMRMVKP